MPAFHHQMADSDAALLEMLTAPTSPKLSLKSGLSRRDAVLDPLLLMAAAASGPHVTRNHYHHDFFPGVTMPQSEGSWDWSKWTGGDAGKKEERQRLTYVSRQAPRRAKKPLEQIVPAKSRRSSLITPSKPSAVQVKCMARTRIPTPHGPAFLHLYHNSQDSKEHLALVIDPAQYQSTPILAPPIRSRTLDAIWSEDETEMDRVTRGAYVGRLTPTSHHASSSTTPYSYILPPSTLVPSPLIRIHSECFTGETVGSMRCDCGEQLDEAIRLISQPISLPPSSPSSRPTTIPGRGAVIYLRQEGRGIGLLSKIKAYNLQDLGHDTVTANLMLGHGADERGYEIASAILRDLGLGGDTEEGTGEAVRLLTNNPDKVHSLEAEGVKIAERVPMVPRSWQQRSQQSSQVPQGKKGGQDVERVVGATLVGGNAVYGEDLDKYLRTKVQRMGHMLPLWLEDKV